MLASRKKAQKQSLRAAKSRIIDGQNFSMTSQRQVLLFFVLGVVWAIWIINSCFDGPHIDISALFMAGWLAGNGQADLIYLAPSQIFNAEPIPMWKEVMAAQGLPDQVVTAYIYPPIWAKLLAWPTHAMSAMTFFKSVYIWHMVAALASACVAYLIVRRQIRPKLLPWGIALFVVLFGTFPAMNSFLNNQPQITVTLLIICGFWLVSRGQSTGGGALVGLAAALKVSPILFALIFLMRRDWSALCAALVVSGGIALLSIIAMGWPLHLTFLERLGEVNDLIVMTKFNYSPEALIYQAVEWFKGTAMPDGRELAVYTAPEPVWITMIIKLMLLGALAAFLFATRDLNKTDALPVQLFLLSLITSIFGPLSWAHYFFMPTLLLPTLFLIMSAKRAWRWIVASLVFTSLTVFALLHPYNHLFMITALVPTLFYLALLADGLRAAHRTGQQQAAMA